MTAQPVVIGGTYDWLLKPAMINTQAAPGVFGIWDITGATVTVSFLYYGNGPDAAPTTVGQHFSATILSGTSGTAHYVNATTLFTTAGTWGITWKVVLSGIVLETEVSFFKVKASGAAL